MEVLEVTKANLTKVFKTWFSDYKKGPAKFQDVDILHSPEEYANDCADYVFNKLSETSLRIKIPNMPEKPEGRTIADPGL